MIWWNHPIYFDVVTHLNGYYHCEPACAQPRVRFLSVSSRLSVKQIIKFAHVVGGDAEKRQVAVGHADSLDQSVQSSFSILPNLIWGPPEDDGGVAVCLVQELIRSSYNPEHASMRYDPQRGPVPDIGLKTQRGGVIHADHTLCVVDLVSCSTSQDVAGAGHQCTFMTV